MKHPWTIAVAGSLMLIVASACATRKQPNGENYYVQATKEYNSHFYQPAIADYQKLIDEYPEAAPAASTLPSATSASDATRREMAGYQLMVNGEIFRGRYRGSFEHPEAIPANEVQEYRFSLHAADHTFLKGHRIKVQVQSTWFPLYDRNPQKFLPNIMTASPDDFVKATVRVYPSSHLILPLAP